MHYYTIVPRADGWHARLSARDDASDDKVFPTREAALAWIRSVGGDLQPGRKAGITIAPEHGGIGNDMVLPEPGTSLTEEEP